MRKASHEYQSKHPNRRKLRSQTSDNMERWKSIRLREENRRREDQRGEREGRKKIQVREKVGKLRLALFCQ